MYNVVEKLRNGEPFADKPGTVEQAARRLKGAVRANVEKHLEALEVPGVVARIEEGKWQARGRVAVGAGK